MIIGTGSINHGFRTPSSIFYLNSLFYLPIIKYFSFHMGAVLIFGLSNLILILKLKSDYSNKRYDFISILTILSAIIMFNLSRNRSLFFHIIFGVLMSVIIYYINFIFNSLGDNGKIPIIASIFLPLILISIVVIIGLVRINEK